GWDEDRSTPNPTSAPGGDRRELLGDPTTHQVVGEELDQERGLVGGETRGGDLADAEAVFQLGDQWLNAGAVVVDAGEIVDVAVVVVGDEELDREVEP